MKRRLLGSLVAGLGLVGSALLIASCSSGEVGDGSEQDFADEGVGAVSEGLSKCAGGKIGDSNYCTSTCKCDAGEGDCDGASECNAPAVCSGRLEQFVPGKIGNACAPAHCSNKVKDVDETPTDCGGSCGTFCPAACTGLPTNPNAGHCTIDCPCPAKEGDCQAATNKCVSGLTCRVDIGALFGYAPSTDVCLATHCSNNVQDGTETGVDCGGTDCGPCSGAAVQSAGYGGTSNDHGLAIAVDGTGNIFVAGRYTGTATFGGADLNSNAGSADIFVAKYNASGIHQWTQSYGNANPDGDNGVAIAVDGSGNLYLAGNFYNSLTLGATTLVSAGGSDIFVAQLNSLGAPTWAKRFGNNGTDRVNAMALTGTSLWIAGAYQTSINFGGGALPSGGSSDGYVARLATANGAHSYSKRYGSTGGDTVTAIAVDTAGNAYVAGNFTGMVNFGLAAAVSKGSTDVFVLKLGSTGTTVWQKAFGGTSNDAANGINVDPARQPTVVGTFKQSVDFGSGTPVASVGTDAFVVAYTTGGIYRWSHALSGNDTDRAHDVVFDGTSNPVIIGDFTGTIDFGTGPQSSAASSTSLFWVRYNVTSGAFQAGAAYGSPGSVTPNAAARYTNTTIITGSFTGSANLGGANLTNRGLIDMFLAKLVN
jgi:hypothetical protein